LSPWLVWHSNQGSWGRDDIKKCVVGNRRHSQDSHVYLFLLLTPATGKETGIQLARKKESLDI
jgi:hypothetical protein